MRECSALLDWLVNGGSCAPAFAVVVAHPDDETIGAGARLDRLGDARFIFVTDGAPRGADETAGAESERAAYARIRRAELGAALSCAGITPPVKFLGCIDQQAAFDLPRLALRLIELLADRDAVLTHPYEGGHPDHDSAACAVRLACRRLARGAHSAPAILEMTSYHAARGSMESGGFLPRSGCAEVTALLSVDERRQKRELFDCYRSQRAILKSFALDVERFRAAPHYDFTAPPHAGTLYYETQDWRIDGAHWRALARAAEREILCV